MKYHRDDDDIFVEYDLEPDGYAEFSWWWLWLIIPITVLLLLGGLWLFWSVIL